MFPALSSASLTVNILTKTMIISTNIPLAIGTSVATAGLYYLLSDKKFKKNLKKSLKNLYIN